MTVTQTAVSATDTILSYSVGGTATSGTDFTALSGTVTILAGDTTATIDIPVIEDLEAEGDETVILTLTSVTAGLATLSTSASATNTIIDDDVDIEAQVARAFQTQVHNYISRRLTLQSRSSPSIYRTLKGCSPDAKPVHGNISLFGDEEGASGSFSIANGRAGCDYGEGPYFWAEAEFSYFRDDDLNDPAVNSSGNYYIGYAGVSLPIDERLTVGLMGQIDYFEDRLESGAGETSGTGWAIGPYLSARLLDNVQLDLRGLWGTSDNSTSQTVLGGNYSGSFDTERLILEGIISGEHKVEEYTFTPSARLFYMREEWDDYTVSNNIRSVTVPGSDAEIGNLSAGLEVNRTINTDEHIVDAFISGEIIWNFQDPGIIDTNGVLTQDDDFSASFSAGVEIANENSSIRLEATYSGLGERGLESIGGEISFSHKF